MHNPYSSTSAGGHQGTGTGTLTQDWNHFNPPADKDKGRDVFTQYEYNAALNAITTAEKTQGSVMVMAVIWNNVKCYKCTQCNEINEGKSLPGPNGCKYGGGRHNWKLMNVWKRGNSKPVKLTYDKSGGIGKGTTVTMH